MSVLDSQLDAVSRNLIEAFQLWYSEDVPELTCPLLRWMDFRLRRIDPRPRCTLPSNGFWRRFPEHVRPALNRILAKARNGDDLNFFLSRTLTRDDTSGKRRGVRTDQLWADWGISHAHIPQNDPEPAAEFCERSDWLLFFAVWNDAIGLIDVRPHADVEWGDPSLLQLAIRSWPERYKRASAPGISPSREIPFTAADIQRMRKGGVGHLIEVDGMTYFPPGLGPTSAGTATNVTLTADRVRSYARGVELQYLDPRTGFIARVAELGADIPQLALAMRPSHPYELGVACTRSRAFSTLHDWGAGTPAAMLMATFLPDWSRAPLARHMQRSCSAEGDDSVILLHTSPD
ncbi:hypothetical protein [Achromobacter ruhlandii]|uniref:hypothetical protein n=1 Tax=Achromobacter ruhlandii TaxID=72557 RepID=UPI0012F4E0B5|nr:hypothetical protein [Achromobacter ruhlandii]